MTAVITREGDWYVARCLQVEVTTQGRTVEEASANLKGALELYFADGAPVPPTVEQPLVTQIEIRVPA
ncbi:MAG: type II toxin-antitoxin system HicB family antitoxin [Candidatus Dormibacteria bacterium]